MLTKTRSLGKNYLNFLWVGVLKDKDISDIYQIIDSNEFVNEDKYLEERKILKQLFLDRLQNMTIADYKNWITIIKRIDNNIFPLVLNDLIIIFCLDDDKLLNLACREMSLYDYNFMNEYNLKNDGKLDKNKIEPYHIINILVEIVMSIRSFIITYSKSSILKNNGIIKSANEVLEDLKKDNSFYYATLEELFTLKFSYLEDSIFKDIYDQSLLLLKDEYRYWVENKYGTYAHGKIYATDKIVKNLNFSHRK